MIWINHYPIGFTTFPNGETKIDAESIISHLNESDLLGKNNHISFKYDNDGDFFRLFAVKDFLDERNLKSFLTIQYMPYSRMDRSENGSVFTLKTAAKLINSMNFSNVNILEPHSDVTPALIDRCIVKYPTRNLFLTVQREQNFRQTNEGDYLFFPDAGAQKRYHMNGWKSLVGYKHRNFETGQIESFQVVGEVPDHPFRAVIMDDLSSYGGTFIASAEQLRKLGATEIYLVVAHAEESILKGKIFETDLIDKVYTTNSIIDISKERDRLRIMDVKYI